MGVDKLKRLFLLVCSFFLFCVFSRPAYSESPKLEVTVSIPPLADFVRNIGKDKVEINIMVPPGANPHSYEPKPGQLKELSKSLIFIEVGSGIEFELAWTDKLAALSPSMSRCSASKGITFISSGGHKGPEDDDIDPHVWLSPLNAVIMVNNIKDALVRLDAPNAEFYSRNAETYTEKLKRLDRKIRDKFSSLSGKTFLVFHPAWGYFAREYGLREEAIEKEGKNPQPRDLARLINLARKNNIKTILVSPQFNRKSAELIAKEIGAKIAVIDPLAGDYIENLERVSLVLSGEKNE